MEENAELYNLSCLIIERAFPIDTDMTPEKLISIIQEMVSEVYA